MVANEPNVVELIDAVALLGDFPALAQLTLQVQTGEVVVIEGPNGAGKTSLLRVCAGLLPLHQGEGKVLGYDLSSRQKRRKLRPLVGLLAHQTFLYDELTVKENIQFWRKANRSKKDAVHPIMERLGLSGRLQDIKVAGLSAGQRRRVAIAVMVARRPHLWLLDEPHAALDHEGKELIDDLVRRAPSFGATVLVASHDHGRVRNIATRAVRLAGGQRMVATGGAFKAPTVEPQPSAASSAVRPPSRAVDGDTTIDARSSEVPPVPPLSNRSLMVDGERTIDVDRNDMTSPTGAKLPRIGRSKTSVQDATQKAGLKSKAASMSETNERSNPPAISTPLPGQGLPRNYINSTGVARSRVSKSKADDDLTIGISSDKTDESEPH